VESKINAQSFERPSLPDVGCHPLSFSLSAAQEVQKRWDQKIASAEA